MLRRRLEDHVLPAFADRILPFDLAAARIFATYRVPDDAPLDDALIAAVAQAGQDRRQAQHRHFEPLGVATLNPWTV